MRIEVESTQLEKLLEDKWYQVLHNPVTTRRLAGMPMTAGMAIVVKEVIEAVVHNLQGIIEVHPAPKDHTIPAQGALLNRDFCVSLLGAVLMWNDGEPIAFTQKDFDAVAGMILLEGRDSDGNYCLAMTKKVDKDEPMQ
jgi:hypothetical protein